MPQQNEEHVPDSAVLAEILVDMQEHEEEDDVEISFADALRSYLGNLSDDAHDAGTDVEYILGLAGRVNAIKRIHTQLGMPTEDPLYFPTFDELMEM